MKRKDKSTHTHPDMHTLYLVSLTRIYIHLQHLIPCPSSSTINQISITSFDKRSQSMTSCYNTPVNQIIYFTSRTAVRDVKWFLNLFFLFSPSSTFNQADTRGAWGTEGSYPQCAMRDGVNPLLASCLSALDPTPTSTLLKTPGAVPVASAAVPPRKARPSIKALQVRSFF